MPACVFRKETGLGTLLQNLSQVRDCLASRVETTVDRITKKITNFRESSCFNTSFENVPNFANATCQSMIFRKQNIGNTKGFEYAPDFYKANGTNRSRRRWDPNFVISGFLPYSTAYLDTFPLSHLYSPKAPEWNISLFG